MSSEMCDKTMETLSPTRRRKSIPQTHRLLIGNFDRIPTMLVGLPAVGDLPDADGANQATMFIGSPHHQHI
jgi:hypothetical protein